MIIINTARVRPPFIMSGPLAQVQDLLLTFYASKGRYPRPNAVTRAEIDEIQRLSALVACDLMAMMSPQTASSKTNNGYLHEIIRKQDQQVDIYEDAELLVGRYSFVIEAPLTTTENGTRRNPTGRASGHSAPNSNG